MVAQNGFALEKELVDILRSGSPAALNVDAGWFRIIAEVAVRERIADLLIIHASAEPDSKPARMSYFEAAILAVLLERGAATAPTVADHLYASAGAVQARAETLARLGLVEIAACGTLRATGRHQHSDARIVAIEAKLTRWREAIEQASHYRAFANQSYIAMPSALFDASGAILSTCEAAGVGALSVAPNGQITIVTEAPVHEPQSPEWVRLVSYVVGVAHSSKAVFHVV